MILQDRLNRRIEKTDTCWNWLGQVTHNGYGFFNQRIDGKAIGGMAHRVVYETFLGKKIAEGMTLDHLCMNRLCVRPSHLEEVTLKENIRRSPRATSLTCKYGHLYKQQSKHYRIKKARRCHKCHAIKESQRRIALSLSKI